MYSQIRLADRQGLLAGRGLSLLQVVAVRYCLVDEQRRERERHTTEFKNAYLASGKVQINEIDITDLFPDAFAEKITDDDMDLDPDTDAVNYRFEDTDLSPEDMERELQQLMGGGPMTVNGKELADGSF